MRNVIEMQWRRCLGMSLVAILVVLVGGVAGAADDETAPLYFLKKGADGAIELVTEQIAEGEMRVFPLSEEVGGYVDVVLPVGVGGSGSIARGFSGGMILARYRNGAIEVTTRPAGGGDPWVRPVMTLEDLRALDIRVSVTAGDGRQAAFLISGYEEVRVDEGGPVVDLFAGKLPFALEADAYTIFTDTIGHHTGALTTGSIPIDYARYLFTEATIRHADGTERTGNFVIDLGSAGTAILRSVLPADAVFEETSMVEYSRAGKKLTKYAPEGATGVIETIAGHTKLGSLTFGDVTFEGPSVAVFESFPELNGRPIDGILGMDLLNDAEAFTLHLGSGGSGAGLEFGVSSTKSKGGAASADDAMIEMPYAIIRSHFSIQTLVNGEPIFFLIDTGSPGILMDGQAAEALGVELVQAEDQKQAKGLDGGSVDTARGELALLELGDRKYENLRCEMANLSVFNTLRSHGQSVSLMGNDFLELFERVEFDLKRQVIRFY